MGHAGAVIAGGKGTAADKYRALDASGARTVKSPADLGKAMAEQLAKRKPAVKKPIGPTVLIIEQKGSSRKQSPKKAKAKAAKKPAPKKQAAAKKKKSAPARRKK
jgi:succinyl-CoA synthetase alpha subunit